MQTEVWAWFLTTNASLDISTFQIMHVRNYKGMKTELLTLSRATEQYCAAGKSGGRGAPEEWCRVPVERWRQSEDCGQR